MSGTRETLIHCVRQTLRVFSSPRPFQLVNWLPMSVCTRIQCTWSIYTTACTIVDQFHQKMSLVCREVDCWTWFIYPLFLFSLRSIFIQFFITLTYFSYFYFVPCVRGKIFVGILMWIVYPCMGRKMNNQNNRIVFWTTVINRINVTMVIIVFASYNKMRIIILGNVFWGWEI